MKRIPPGALLTPIDLSTASLRAVIRAVDLAARIRAPLVLLHVISPRDVEDGLAEGRYVDQQLEDIRGNLLSWFATFVPEAMRREVSVTPLAVVGHPEQEIPALARAIQAQMIVMATHGRTGLSRVVLGSVAEAVLRHAPCPVLAIPPQAAPAAAESMPGRPGGVDEIVAPGRQPDRVAGGARGHGTSVAIDQDKEVVRCARVS